MLNNKLKNCILIALFSLALGSCSSDDSSDETPVDTSKSKYLFSVRMADFTEYLWKVNSLDELMTGTIDMTGKGIERPGWGLYLPVDNTVFSCAMGDDPAISYVLNENGDITPKGQMFVESSYAAGMTDDNKAIIIGASWEGTSLQNEIAIYDPKTVSFTKKKVHEFSMQYEGKTLQLWPTGAQAIGNKLFVSVYPRTPDQDWFTPVMDRAIVKVFDYPSLEAVSTIEDTRTGPIGIYYNNTGTIQTENGDVYTFSTNAYSAGYTQTGKPSGILRIAKGTANFDQAYFLNFEESVVKGKILATYYAGGNKVFIDYIPKELDTPEALWAYFNNTLPMFKLAMVDLVTKQVTPVTGLPDHGCDNYYGPGSLFVEDGKAYKSFTTNTETRIYRIDIATAKATAGALVNAAYVPLITKLKY